MSHITEIRYEFTRNLGNYQSEKIGATAALSETDDANKALAELKSFVLGETKAEVKQEKLPLEKYAEENTKAVEAMLPKEEVVGVQAPIVEKKKAAPKKKSEEKKVEAEPVEEKKEEAAPAKKFKVKGQTYDRSSGTHKHLFSLLLDKHIPTWKSNPALAKSISEKMEGTDFLDSEGQYLPTFTDAVLSAWK